MIEGRIHMAFFTISGIKIEGIASAVPKNIVYADDFAGYYGLDAVRRVQKMTGIKEFRHTSKYQTASDLGVAAAKELIEKLNFDPDSIQILIFVSQSPDYRKPSTACVIHQRLGLDKSCMAFDINQGCSGFIYGLTTAGALMTASGAKQALLITAETPGKHVYPEDRSTALISGEAGCAILLGRDERAEEIKSIVCSNGEHYKSLIVPAGGFRNPDAPHDVFMWPDENKRTLYNTYMNGMDVFEFTLTDVPKTIKDFLNVTGTTLDDYDKIVLHQANQYILKQLSRKCGIPKEKVPVALEKYGNTSGASIPLTICDTYGDACDGKQRLLMSGFGVGLSWGVMSACIDTACIFPVIETDECFMEGVFNSPEDFFVGE